MVCGQLMKSDTYHPDWNELDVAKMANQKAMQGKITAARRVSEAEKGLGMKKETMARRQAMEDDSVQWQRTLSAAREPLAGAQREVRRMKASMETLEKESTSWDQAMVGLKEGQIK